MARITGMMKRNEFLTNINANQGRVSKYSNQIATGRQMMSIDESSVQVVNTFIARQQLNSYNSYAKTVELSKGWADIAETSLRDMNTTVQSLYELTNQAASDTLTHSDRANIAVNVKELIGHVVDLCNTSYSGQYIFGGHNTSSVPFVQSTDADGKMTVKYNGMDLSTITKDPGADSGVTRTVITDNPNPGDTEEIRLTNGELLEWEESQHIMFETGFFDLTQMGVNGIEITGVGSDNIFAKLDELYTLMNGGGTASELSAKLTVLDEMQTGILKNIVKIGSQYNKLEILEARYSQAILISTELKSVTEDVSQGDAIMNLKINEALYSQSLAVGARMVQSSLLDFLT